MLWHPYWLTAVVPFAGTKEAGFSAGLMLDGRRVAHVVDEGNRGPLLWTFLGGLEERDRDAAALDAYAESLPMEADETSSFDEWCRDAFAVRLFEDHQLMRRLSALTNQRMVLLVPHIQRGLLPTVLPFSYDPSVRAMIKARYGPGTVILNELPGRWWPTGHGRPGSTGHGRGAGHVLEATRDATGGSTFAGGPAQHPPSVVQRHVQLRDRDVPDPGRGLPSPPGTRV